VLPEDRVAERRAESLEHRRPQHERLQIRLVGGEHLTRQEIDDVRARPVERRDQTVLVGRAGQ
jgi:hypothetical protein